MIKKAGSFSTTSSATCGTRTTTSYVPAIRLHPSKLTFRQGYLKYCIGISCVEDDSHVHWFTFRFRDFLDFINFEFFFDRGFDLARAHHDRRLSLLNQIVEDIRLTTLEADTAALANASVRRASTSDVDDDSSASDSDEIRGGDSGSSEQGSVDGDVEDSTDA